MHPREENRARRGFVTLGAAAILTSLALLAAAGLGGGGREELVTLEAPDGPPRLVSRSVARQQVSARVGFEVKIPERLPDGFEVGSIGSVSTVWPNSVLSLKEKSPTAAGTSILITQTPSRFSPPNAQDNPTKLELGMAGPEAYEIVTTSAVNYIVLTTSSGFAISITPKESAPSRAEMVEVIKSLAK